MKLIVVEMIRERGAALPGLRWPGAAEAISHLSTFQERDGTKGTLTNNNRNNHLLLPPT
jgi:hypothetical protein